VCDGLTGYQVQAVADAAFEAARVKQTVAVEPF